MSVTLGVRAMIKRTTKQSYVCRFLFLNQTQHELSMNVTLGGCSSNGKKDNFSSNSHNFTFLRELETRQEIGWRSTSPILSRDHNNKGNPVAFHLLIFFYISSFDFF